MKIARIVCTPFTLPLRKPVHFALATMHVSEHVLVEVVTDDGLVGTADAPSRPWSGFYGESQASIVHAIDKWFAPALIGLDPFAIERVWSLLSLVEHNNAAKAALDVALHDIMGQALGLSCRRLLGGWDAALRMVYICGGGPPEAVAEEALAIHARTGINAFKLKIGIDPRQDEAMLTKVRALLPDASLNLDGNQGLSAQDAMRVLDAAAANGIDWAEEPCSVHDRAGRRRVAAASRVPILGDESCRTPEEAMREIVDQSVHLVAIKTARTGFSLSRQILGAATAARAGAVVASHADSGVGLIAGWHFAAAHRATQRWPTELSFHLHYADDVLAAPLAISGGTMALPETPGLGIAIDREKLARYRTA